MSLRRVLAALAFVMASTACLAQAPAVSYNVITLQAEAEREVDNDLLQAVLYAEVSGTDASRVAESLNALMSAALKTASQYPKVRARSGNYTTFPVYDERRRLTQWRGRSELRLESGDFAAASELIGKLQSTLQVSSLNFAVSNATRRRVQDELIGEAIAAFRARAEVAQKAVGGRSYKLRQLNIGTGFQGPQPLAMEARTLSAAPQAPRLEAGSSRVSVSASGSVEVE
jgi:predicted secreted protein